MVKLNLGSGMNIKRGFINVDLYDPEEIKNHTGICVNSTWKKGMTYIQADIRALPFKNNSADYVEMFEVLEHIPFRQTVEVLKEIRRVMKKGAKLYLHTPNFDGLVRDWLDIAMGKFDYPTYLNVIETLFGNQLANGEFHNAPFNPQLMNYYLVEAGFKQGKMEVIRKGSPLPKFGTETYPEGTVARNEVLLVEVTK